MSTTTNTEAARICGELVTLLTLAREYIQKPGEYSQFHAGNLVSTAAALNEDLYDLLLKDAAPAIRARQSSEGGEA